MRKLDQSAVGLMKFLKWQQSWSVIVIMNLSEIIVIINLNIMQHWLKLE